MKSAIHPQYNDVTFTCACGNTFQAGSTSKENVRVEICAKCHPLYTGKSNLIDTTGRLERFENRFAKSQILKNKNSKNAAVNEESKKATEETAAE